MWKGDAEFNRKCGEILEISLNIEQVLEHFVSAYCGFCGSYKKSVHGVLTVFQTLATESNIHKIQRLIQTRLSFKEKIDIFEEICKAEKVDRKDYGPILNKIKNIQNIRNQVAHDDRYFTSSMKLGIVKKRRKFLLRADDFRTFFQVDSRPSLELTDVILKELNRDQNSIITYAYQLLDKLLKRQESQNLNEESVCKESKDE